jgi:peroxiredoxin
MEIADVRFMRCPIRAAILLCYLALPGYCQDAPLAPFDIRTTDGSAFSLADNVEKKQLTVICFLGTECPLVKLYCLRLNELSTQMAGQPVRFLGIDSNLQDSEEELIAFSERQNLNFPVAKDHRNLIADQFGALRTPEVFVLDADFRVRYRGRIDDQYEPGISKPKPTRNDLQVAIEELLAGQPVSTPRTESEGCLIGRVKEADVASAITFSNQVSRLLQKHCVECHRAGDIGPFSLTDYEEVVGWADMLLEVIDDGRMPPWHANPQYGDYLNARHMPEADKQTLRDWVAAGVPFGNPQELPEPYRSHIGWNLPKEPDVVIPMRDKPFAIPAEGSVEYQYFVVDPEFKEDKWVVAAEVLPGNRSVVHHSIVFVRPPDGVSFDGIGWLGAYVPGQRETTYPAGYARKIPAGSKFVFQQHYTPVGTAQTDLTRVGIVFADEADVTHKVFTLIALEQDFEIPPHAANYPVTARLRKLPAEGKLLALAPHMHFRGKSFRVTTKTGDQEEILLDVPNYDFNWQHVYGLRQPLALGDLDELKFVATFDNSTENPVNPDPSKPVFWGDQTWEEMAVAFFEVAQQRNLSESSQVHSQPSTDIMSAHEQRLAEAYVNDFFARFDQNLDGVITQDELPRMVWKRARNSLDLNGDKIVERDEVVGAARELFHEHDNRTAGN